MNEAEKVSLREFFIHVMNERDRRYDQRFLDHERQLSAVLASSKEMSATHQDLVVRVSSLEISRSAQSGAKEEHKGATKETGDMMARMLSLAAVVVAAIAALAVWVHK